jgi:DNA-binding PadR family transcriptional regulator
MFNNPYFHFAGRGRGGGRHGRGPFGGGQGPFGGGGGPFGGQGRPPFGGPPPPFGFWNAFRRGGMRARRGDVRAGILALLNEGPRNGYQIMQELEQRSRGAWRPSPGSVYPALQQLEDEGLITQEQSPSGRVYALTERGKEHVKSENIGAPWEAMAEAPERPGADLVTELRALGGAVFQLTQAGAPSQVAEAKKILAQARKQLYGLLAQDGDDE